MLGIYELERQFKSATKCARIGHDLHPSCQLLYLDLIISFTIAGSCVTSDWMDV